MMNYWRRREEMNANYKQFNNTSAGRATLIICIVFTAMTLLLLLIPLFHSEDISWRTTMLIKGCTGLSAILSLIAYAIYAYMANSSYWNRRNSL